MVNLIKRTNTDIIRMLQPDSEVLENVTQGFHTMLRSREQAHGANIQITCFVKELPVTKAGKSFMLRSIPHSDLRVDSKQVVPSKSAILERYPYAFIHADHIDVTKIEGRNHDNKNVDPQLKRWIKESLPRFDRNIAYRIAPT